MLRVERPRSIVTEHRDWSGTTRNFLLQEPGWVWSDLILHSLIVPWTVWIDNKLHCKCTFMFVRNDTKVLSNNSSVFIESDAKLLLNKYSIHVQNEINQVFTNLYIYVQNDRKLQSISSTRGCLKWHQTIEQLRAMKPLEKDTRISLSFDQNDTQRKTCAMAINCLEARTSEILSRRINFHDS